MAKRLLVGRPLSSAEADHQRLPKTIALATFSSDPISSTAYATEEILFVTAVGASSLALGLDKLVPMAIAVAVLLVIVVTSRQTIFAYPNGGGAYIVSRENLLEYPSLVAAASLLIDYILTVAVSVSAGVAAILSLGAFHDLEDQRVAICLFFVVLLTAGNLRGLKESGKSSRPRPTSTSWSSPSWSSTASAGSFSGADRGSVFHVPLTATARVGTQEEPWQRRPRR